MHGNLILIVLCAIIIISHFFNVIAKRFRIPTVLLLIGLGMLLKGWSLSLNLEMGDVRPYLGFLGTMGLILIVLDGASDLEIKRKNWASIMASFNAALGILLMSSWGLAALFHFGFKADIRTALVNAIPLGVISSAVAIPTVAGFIMPKKEFLIYESIFSDILGILLFNFMVGPSLLNHVAVTGFFVQFGIIIVTSLLSAILLIFVLHSLKAQVKFFIILALLVLIYAVGGVFNLPSLLLVFVFGLFLKNIHAFPKAAALLGGISSQEVGTDIEQFKLIVTESAFLIRTFFFVVFGYSIDFTHDFNAQDLLAGVLAMLILFLVRYLYLRLMAKSHVWPETFIAPRGLVTIALFNSIPARMMMGSFGRGEMLFVVLASNLLILWGFFRKPPSPRDYTQILSPERFA